MKKAWAVVVASCVLAACGASLYKPLSSNGSSEALKEDALIALDDDDFAKAEEKLAKLWANDHSNEIAQLYAVALLGRGQFVLFDIIKSAILFASEQGQEGGGTDVMNQLATNAAEILGGEVTIERQNYALRALSVLEAADDQSDAGLTFQKCLTAGIYAVPVLDSVTAIKEKLTQIQRTQAASDVCGNAALANRLESDVSVLISEAGAVSSSLSAIGGVLGACLPKEQNAEVNAVTMRVQAILNTADKGCDIAVGDVQTIGNVALPVCLNDAITSTAQGSAARDGKVSGCELFLHCGGGSCF